MKNSKTISCVIVDGIFFQVKSVGRTKVMAVSSRNENRTFARDAVELVDVSVKDWNIQVGGAKVAMDYALAAAFEQELAAFGRSGRSLLFS